jgi:hypothetical protein
MSGRRTWVQMGCGQTGTTMLARFELSGDEWCLVSATEFDGGESRSPQAEPMAGSFNVSPGYPGCPDCHANSFVRCGACGELGCWSAPDALFRCGFCGNEGPVSGRIEQVLPSDWV